MRWRMIALALFVSSAHAQEETRTYFEGERKSGFLWGGMGLASLGTGIGFAASKNDLLMGMAGPMIGVGAIQAAFGSVMLFRTPSRVAKLELEWKENPDAIRARERERVAGVNRTFVALGVVESLLLVSGAIVLGAGAAADLDTVRGAGIGIAIEMATFLIGDGLAHRRAEIYERALIPLSGGTK